MDHLKSNRRLTASVRMGLISALIIGLNIYYTYSVLGHDPSAEQPQGMEETAGLVDSLQQLENDQEELMAEISGLEADTVSLVDQQAKLETSIETLTKELEELKEDIKINRLLLRN